MSTCHPRSRIGSLTPLPLGTTRYSAQKAAKRSAPTMTEINGSGLGSAAGLGPAGKAATSFVDGLVTWSWRMFWNGRCGHLSEGNQARERAEELQRRIAEGRRTSREADVSLASKRLIEAQRRTRQALLNSAAAHDLATESHEQAADAGAGDVEAHKQAATDHRAAAEADRRRADRSI